MASTALVPHVSSRLALHSGAARGDWMGGALRFVVRAAVRCEPALALAIAVRFFAHDDLQFEVAVLDALPR